MVNINRKITIYILSFLLSILVLNPIMANAEGFRVFDDADLFTQTEIDKLNAEANIIARDYDMDIILVTTNDTNGKSSREYADDYYDNNGFGLGTDADGILFLIDMDNREAYISTSGIGIRYLTDQRIESILEDVFDGGLANGDYYNASKSFLSSAKAYLKSGIPSDQYSQDENEKGKNSLTFLESIISIITGGLASIGFFFGIKSKYKMKNPVKPLNFRSNSVVNLASNEDRLIDTFITHKIIPKASNNNSSSGKSTTHTSSSGKTHGGGGKSF